MPEENKEQGESGKKKKIPLWIYLPFAVVFLGVCAGAYFFVMNNNQSGGSSEATRTRNTVQTKQSLGPTIDLQDFVVNILDGEQMHYLKAAITIEATDDKTKEEIQKRNPQIRDAIILLMGNKKYDELRDLQGKLQLRAELMKRINSLLSQGAIENVFFTEFVVQ